MSNKEVALRNGLRDAGLLPAALLKADLLGVSLLELFETLLRDVPIDSKEGLPDTEAAQRMQEIWDQESKDIREDPKSLHRKMQQYTSSVGYETMTYEEARDLWEC